MNIKPITTLTIDDYINFYDGNKIVLIPSYLDNNIKPHYFCNYSGMTKTNYKIIELLKKREEQKKGKDTKDSRMKDDEDHYDIDNYEDDEHKPNGNYYKYKDQNN